MVNCVYICSAGHSGSTLLDLILGSHSSVCSMGEISHLTKNLALNSLCSCGACIRDCMIWQEVFKKLSVITGKDLFKSPYDLHLGYPLATNVVDKTHQTEMYKVKRKLILGLRYLQLTHGVMLPRFLLNSIHQSLSNNFMLYDVIREVRNAEIVVDSSKDYMKGAGLYLKAPSNVRIILLSRDGRGVLYSNLKRNHPLHRSVNGWKRYYERALPILEKNVNPQHIFPVKYEELVKSPERVVRAICAFIGIEYESEMLNYAMADHHTTNGNNMRMSRNNEIRADIGWTQKLRLADQQYFKKIAGHLNKHLGYE